MPKSKLSYKLKEVKTTEEIELQAISKGKKIGRISFTLHLVYNNPELIMIYVEPEFRRKGIATKMLTYLQDKYGDINWGSKTTDGTYLHKSFYNV